MIAFFEGHTMSDVSMRRSELQQQQTITFNSHLGVYLMSQNKCM